MKMPPKEFPRAGNIAHSLFLHTPCVTCAHTHGYKNHYFLRSPHTLFIITILGHTKLLEHFFICPLLRIREQPYCVLRSISSLQQKRGTLAPCLHFKYTHNYMSILNTNITYEGDGCRTNWVKEIKNESELLSDINT